MFCPNCRAEYSKNIRECSDCKISLVPELPPEPKIEYKDLVTVFMSTDSAKLIIAKSLLDNAGIQYWAKGEGLQELFGGGRIGTGYNVLVRPVELQVDQEHSKTAMALLDDLKGGNEG